MLVSEILSSKGSTVVTVAPRADALALAGLFKSERIGAAVVLGDSDAPLGIVAERDIVNAIAQHGKKALKFRACDLMRSPATSCRPEDDLKHVMAVMTHRRVRHIAVTDAGGLLCGIVSIGDVVKPHLDETALEINVLRDYARLRAV